MNSFDTAADARAFLRDIVDVRIPDEREIIDGRIALTASTLELDNGRFTNVYDISYREGEATPAVHLHDQLTSVYDFLKSKTTHGAATGGGFFYLVDKASGAPRQLALNLAMQNGNVHSLPVADREAVISQSNNLSAMRLQALGLLSINGKELSWSGSLTDHETDVKVFGNGNAVIQHEQNEATGSIRVLDERSRFTPDMQSGDMVDVGFIARNDGSFAGGGISTKGNLDIFAHDFVLRYPDRYLADNTTLQLYTIGSLALDGGVEGALTAGPMLETTNFINHPINQDASLGSRPPFLEKPFACMVLYKTENGMVHLRLFDGRPGSETFPGVTPGEAVKLIEAEGAIEWGCFLDSGQTAKLCVSTPKNITSRGNAHYFKWATQPHEKYIWKPGYGRPAATAITLH